MTATSDAESPDDEAAAAAPVATIPQDAAEEQPVPAALEAVQAETAEPVATAPQEDSLPEQAAVATKTEQIVAAVEPEQVATAAPAPVVSEPTPEPVVAAAPVPEPVTLESNPVVVQVVADSAPEPAPIQGDLLEIVAQAGLELVETAHAAPEVVAAPVARPPRPRRKRKAAPVIAEEPLAQVETGRSLD